eukprot:5167033-Prorocentrum_lima.AAC.1
MPRQSRLGTEGFVTNVTEMQTRSGQQLNLCAIKERRRRGPAPENTPKGGLQKEEIEGKPIQRGRNLNLLTIS